MMRPWLTGIISNLSGMNTHLLMAYFLPPCASLQRKKAERSRPLAQLVPFLLFPFPNTLSSHPRIILDSQIPIRFQGEGQILFLRLFVGEEIDAICLPLFSPPSGLDLTKGRNEGVHPVVSHVLCATQDFAQKYHFRVCSHLLEILVATSESL